MAEHKRLCVGCASTVSPLNGLSVAYHSKGIINRDTMDLFSPVNFFG